MNIATPATLHAALTSPATLAHLTRLCRSKAKGQRAKVKGMRTKLPTYGPVYAAFTIASIDALEASASRFEAHVATLDAIPRRRVAARRVRR